MRILLTNTGPWGTGSFAVVVAIAKEFQKLGHEVKIFFPDSDIAFEGKSPYDDDPALYEAWQFPIKEADSEIPIYPLITPHPQPRNPAGLDFKSLSDAQFNLYFKVLKQKLKKIIADFKPDVIECQHIWAMNYIVGELGYPHIVSAHMSDQIGFNYDPRMQFYASVGAARAESVFAVSRHVKAILMKDYNIQDEKIVVIPNALDHEVFRKKTVDRKKILEDLGVSTIPDDAKLVTFTGRVALLKGIDTILQANQLFRGKHKIHFLIFGEGNVRDILDVDQYQLDRMHFLGHHWPETLSKAHNISELSIAPSRREGFGIAVLEAMACGLPVVVTRCGGPEDFAVGKIIDQESPAQLAEAIIKIINLPQVQYQALSELSQKTASLFTWEKNAKMRLEYYRKLPAIKY